MEQPDRYEWLHAEQERRARDPHGFVALRSRVVRSVQRRIGVLLAVVPPMLVMGILFEGRSSPFEPIGWIVLGLAELGAAVVIWRLVRRKTPMIRAAGWAALALGAFALPFGIWFIPPPHAPAQAAASDARPG